MMNHTKLSNADHLFSHLKTSKKKFLWNTFLYGPKKLQEGFALFFFSFLSPRKETNVHGLNVPKCPVKNQNPNLKIYTPGVQSLDKVTKKWSSASGDGGGAPELLHHLAG